MEYRKFRSPSKPIFIASVSGHSISIGEDFTEVPDILWGQAYAAGALSEDMKIDSMASYLKEKEEEQEQERLKDREEIKKALLEVYKKPVGFVDNNNRPLTRKVLGLLQKPVKKDVIDSVWDEIVAEQEGQ